MKVRDVLKLAAERGWYLSAQKGSDRQFKHPTLAGKVTVAGHPSEEMAEETFESVLSQMEAKWPNTLSSLSSPRPVGALMCRTGLGLELQARRLRRLKL